MTDSTVPLRDRLAKLALDGLIAVSVSIGYKLELFKAIADVASPEKPATPKTIAEKANCKERYVKEWLAVLSTSGYIQMNEKEEFWLKPEDVQDLTVDNPGLSQCLYVPCYMKAYENLLNVFRADGPLGLKYSDFNDFYAMMNLESKLTHEEHFISEFIPALSSSLHNELKLGNKKVLDVGCGTGLHSILLAQSYPLSNFTGIDVTSEAIIRANQKSKEGGLKLDNLSFINMDGGVMNADWTEQFDVVIIVDACHDQMRPDKTLKEIHRVLKPGGVFGMLEIIGTSNIYEDKQKYGELATTLYCSSMYHCLPVGSNCEGALGLGAMWGSRRAVELLNNCGFSNVKVVQTPHFAINQLYVCRKA